jgi:hypothetical protein
MISDNEYQIVTALLDKVSSPVPSAFDAALNSALLNIIDDAESSGREAKFEIVSHSLTPVQGGFLVSFLFKLLTK